MKLIDKIMTELIDAGLSPEHAPLVRENIVDYAISACMDSDVRDEAMAVAQEMGI